MNKKKVILFEVLFLLFNFCFIQQCYASVANNINYEIASFSITNTGVINMTGWSFIDHVDNYGNKSLSTDVVAYTGNWNSNYENCSANSKKCKKYTATVGGVMIDNHIVDVYYIRCTDSACTSSQHNNRKKYIENNNGYGEADVCTNSGSYGGSHCLYYDLGFSVKIPISDLLNKFGDDVTVKFRIVSTVKYRISSKKTGTLRDSTDIGILPDVCSTIFETNCKRKSNTTFTSAWNKVVGSEKTEIVNGVKKTSYEVTRNEVTIGKMEDKVQFTAVNARRFTSKSTSSSSGTFRTDSSNQSHKVVTYSTSVSEFKNYKGNQKGTFYARMIKLEEGNSDYWAFTSWVKAAGNLELKLKKTVKTETEDCPTGCCGEECSTKKTCDFQCIGGNCNYDVENGICNVEAPIGIVNPTCNALSYSGCSDFSSGDKECGQQAISKAQYYYKVSSNYLLDKFGDKSNIVANVPIVSGDTSSIVYKYNAGNGSYDYYFPILFKTNVSFTQSISFKHDSNFSNGMSAVSGRYFPYSFQFTVSGKWNTLATMNANSVTATSQNNTYAATIPVKDAASGVSFNVSLGLKTGETIYKRNADGSFSGVVYGVDLYKDIAKSYVANNRYRNLSSSDVVIVFDDSNDKNNKLNTYPGNLSCVGATNAVWNPNEIRTMTCNYAIRKAYYKNSGNDYASYFYPATKPSDASYVETINGSGIYYVPLGDNYSFQFKITSNTLSLINGWGVSYDSTCNVNVINQINKVKYRSISVTNPFPNASSTDDLPSNWKEYVISHGGLNNGGLSRITNLSYSKVFYQTKKFDNVSKKSLSNFDNLYGSYASDADMDSEGQSKVVRGQDNIFESISAIVRINHCTSGVYSENCDRVS